MNFSTRFLKKLTRSTGAVVALLCVVSSACLGLQVVPAFQGPTTKPFLWRIEGPVPSYLYGTIHLPDSRVLDMPEVVRQAIAASDGIFTELPIDATLKVAAA